MTASDRPATAAGPRKGPLLTDKATMRIVTLRSRRIIRGFAVFIVGMAALVILSLATRDGQELHRCEANLQFAADQFNRTPQSGLPFVLPQPTEGSLLQNRYRQSHFRYLPSNRELAATIKPVGICQCERPHDLFLREDGRHVMVFDGAKYEVRWMPEAEFASRAASLALERPAATDVK